MSAGQSKELVRLAASPRRGKQGKGDDEFRISLDEFQSDDGKNSQYVSIRVWWIGREGEWLPGKQGITVRKNELRRTIEALERAEKILSGKETLTVPESTPSPRDQRHEEREGSFPF